MIKPRAERQRIPDFIPNKEKIFFFSPQRPVDLLCRVVGGRAVRSAKLNTNLYVLPMLGMRVGKSSFLLMPLVSSRLKPNRQRLLFFTYLLDLFSCILFYSVPWQKLHFPVCHLQWKGTHTEWPKKMYTLFTHQYLWNKFK